MMVKLNLLIRKRVSLEASSVSMTELSRPKPMYDAFLVRPNVTPNRQENRLCKLTKKEQKFKSNRKKHSMFKAQLFHRS